MILTYAYRHEIHLEPVLVRLPALLNQSQLLLLPLLLFPRPNSLQQHLSPRQRLQLLVFPRLNPPPAVQLQST
jgi:hypothetical protein